jgi:hypothetical protein
MMPSFAASFERFSYSAALSVKAKYIHYLATYVA